MLNKVLLIGRLGKDPELRYVSQGMPVTTFSLATERSWRDADGQVQTETEWHHLVVWNKLAELCNAHLRQGGRIYVEGRLKTRHWEDERKVKNQRTEIIVEEVKFLSDHRNGHRMGSVGKEDLP